MGKRIISVALIFTMSILLFSGCANKKEEVPKLLEPIAVNEAYRAVERGDVGTPKYEFAKVAALEYGQTFNSEVLVADITVKCGDYVNKGDVIAYAELASTKKELEAVQKELADFNEIHRMEKRNADLELSMLEKSGATKTEIDTFKENRRYEEELYSKQLEIFNKSVAELEKTIAAGTLKANCSGYVSYIKNIYSNPNAGSDENIVVIMDRDHKYLSTKIAVNAYKWNDACESKYTMIHGEKKDVRTLDYSSEELAYAKFRNQLPCVRLVCDGVDDLIIGDTYVVYYCEKSSTNVLYVSNDSLFNDDGNYVYVLENGKKIRHDVTIGLKDNYYTEIVEGLNEGDLVYYSSDAVLPVDFVSYNVELRDFSKKNHTKTFDMADSRIVFVSSDYAGEVTDVSENFAWGKPVAKGDYLYTVKVVNGKASIADVQLKLKRAKEDYASTIQSYEKELAELKKNESSDENNNLIEICEHNKKMAEINGQKNIEELETEYKKISENNDNGSIKVYSKYDGKLNYVDVKLGMKIKEDDATYSVSQKGEGLIYVKMVEIKSNSSSDMVYQDVNDAADIGEKVRIDISENEAYFGECVGEIRTDDDKVFLSTSDGKIMLTKSMFVEYRENGFFLKMDSDKIYDRIDLGGMVEFESNTMRDVVVIPKNMNLVHQEFTKKGDTFNYVWKVVGDKLVKQYVEFEQEYEFGNDLVIISGLKAGDVIAG